MITGNQNPEQLVRDQIDKMLQASGWIVQAKKEINLAANSGHAVWEYQTKVSSGDYILFVDKRFVVVIEARRYAIKLANPLISIPFNLSFNNIAILGTATTKLNYEYLRYSAIS